LPRVPVPHTPSSAVIMKGWSYTSTPPTGRTVCTGPQCLYKGALYLTPVPVQGCTLPYLSACTRMHFTLPLPSHVSVMLRRVDSIKQAVHNQL